MNIFQAILNFIRSFLAANGEHEATKPPLAKPYVPPPPGAKAKVTKIVPKPALRSGDPAWITQARKYLGEREIKGPHHNPHVLKFWKELNQPIRDDETPWCGGFVGGVLAEVGIKPVSGPAGARNWLKMPVKLKEPAYGCVVVFWRGSKSGWSGHVGFVVGKDSRGNIMVLGGNQGDMVSIKPFSKTRVLGYRWPGIAPYPERYQLPLLTSDGRVSANEA